MAAPLAERLSAIVGSSNLLQAEEVRKIYAGDGLVPPLVVQPRRREEASEVIALGQKDSLGVVFRGGGTQMRMGNIPSRLHLLLSTQNLNRVIDLDGENLTITLEAGTRLSEIQDRLHGEGRGYFIPLDPPFTEGATLGGILATNSSGPKRLLYGTSRDFVLGMKVIQADGKVTSFGGKTVKNVSGFDMSKLYIGSMGTLGMILEATVRLLPLPEEEKTLLAFFSESGKAFQVANTVLASQLVPSSMEILSPGAAAYLQPEGMIQKGNCVIAIGIEGVAQAVDRQIGEISGICQKFQPSGLEALGGEEQDGFWRSLRDITLLMMHPFPQSLILKINVPLSKTAAMFAWAEEIARNGSFVHALWAHGGSGILRVAFLLDAIAAQEPAVVQAIQKLTAKAAGMEGNLMVESAPASIKPKIAVWGQEKGDGRVFRQIKLALDPASLFNPGRFVGGI